MKLSEKIIELRKANGMTQEELAAKCNVIHIQVGSGYCVAGNGEIVNTGRIVSCFHGCVVKGRIDTKRSEGSA